MALNIQIWFKKEISIYEKKNTFYINTFYYSIMYLFIFSCSSSDNANLELNEIKAYFRPNISLTYYPNIVEISEVRIGGTASMPYYDMFEHGCAIYNNKNNIEQITDYLNDLNLVNSSEDELPNKSCDSFIQYYDNNGNLVKNLLIYGEIFVKDVNNNKIYRIKKTNVGIIEGLEMLFDICSSHMPEDNNFFSFN